MEYYANVSISIENDEIFSIMMNNVWNISGNTFNFSNYDNSNSSQSMYRYTDPSERRPNTAAFTQSPSKINQRGHFRSSQGSQDNPLAASQTSKYYQQHEEQQKEILDKAKSSMGRLEENKKNATYS